MARRAAGLLGPSLVTFKFNLIMTALSKGQKHQLLFCENYNPLLCDVVPSGKAYGWLGLGSGMLIRRSKGNLQ